MSTSHQAPSAFLHPGEFHFTQSPAHIGTLLGSCVAVTVWHPPRKLGGMCHILLPRRERRPMGSPPDTRFADEAIERFTHELRARRIAPTDCQVKVFGGGTMFAGTLTGRMDIGNRNIEATRIALKAHGYAVSVEDVGGRHRRRLYLDLATGHVWMARPGDAPATPIR